jgi:NAD(P)-dependent dehydrogenase (short-subunit alcohol dehydrogenase family)
MLIATGALRPDALTGQVAVVTGAGGGIGFEAARALLWLGARVVIAEIDESSGSGAARRLRQEWPDSDVLFIATDVGDEVAAGRLVETTRAQLGPIDIVLNNAAVAAVGEAVVGTPIADWDRSYAVNLRGPVLLARACLPSMISRGRGTFVCVSSTGGPFLGSYESLKAAQVALSNTLDAELSGSGVTAFTIGPGLVPTATASAAVERIAPKLGMSLDEFYTMNRGALLSVEAAGAGFAAAVAQAERYAGQEISSSQALVDAGIAIPDDAAPPAGVTLAATVDASSRNVAGQLAQATELCQAVGFTLDQQAAEWRARSFFERQWMIRDFKQRAGMPVERWIEALDRLEARLRSADRLPSSADLPPLEKLAGFYGHLADLARGYVKDPAERAAQAAVVSGWRAEVEQLRLALTSQS